MHLLLIHQAFTVPGLPGGTRHYELARHLVRQGHRVSVVASQVDYISGKKVPLPIDQTVDGIRVVRAPMPSSLHRSLVHRATSLIAFTFTSLPSSVRLGRPDLVMGTSPSLFQAYAAWSLARRWQCPFLLEIRDLWPDFIIDMGAMRNPHLIRTALAAEKFLYRAASHILVNSPAYRDIIAAKGVDAAKISLIPNGVDTDAITPQPGDPVMRRRLGGEGRFLAAYTGAMGPANGLELVLAAAELLRHRPDIHLALVGNGKARPSLEEMAREKRLSNLTFAGPFGKDQMPKVLASCDAALAVLRDIPMFRTTYPNKVFDYMAAGKPTVLSIDGVIRDVVERARGGLFSPPGDASAMAQVLEHLADDPGLAKEMGLRAREHVVREFDRSRHAQAFIELLEQVAGDG